MSALFAFKLTLVPFFILALSLAGRRWGTAAVPSCVRSIDAAM